MRAGSLRSAGQSTEQKEPPDLALDHPHLSSLLLARTSAGTSQSETWKYQSIVAAHDKP